MKFNLENSISLLQATPLVIRAWLSHLPADLLKSNEGEGTWSPFDIVGHLVHGEKTDWIPRAEIILSKGEDKEFTPFDRFTMFEENESKSIHDLLLEFEELRRQNLEHLRSMNLSDADLDKTGVHPELGIVTLRQLISTWVVHDLNHLGQIAGVMAHQYEHEVGPWRQYLGILGSWQS